MTDALPPYVTRAEVQRRLLLIFPEGSPNRLYCTREMAASTVFALLYIGAVEGTGRFLGPKHVYRMSDAQASWRGDDARLDFAQRALKPSFEPEGKPWYADTTREPIRDETLREGLVAVGAVVVREGIPTTSSKPRYALATDFASLFDPGLTHKAFDAACAAWQQARLSTGALARVHLQRAGAAAGAQGVLVTFPNGETLRLAAGPSSVITKAVVEDFAPAFLERPAVIWLSESGNKVVARDDKLASQIGLDIRPDKDLPDIILADLGAPEPLLVFVEAVATDGSVAPRQQQALLAVAAAAFRPENVAFVTAYRDREAPAFRKTFGQIAWRSFVWFANEPRQLVGLHDAADGTLRLSALLRGLGGRRDAKCPTARRRVPRSRVASSGECAPVRVRRMLTTSDHGRVSRCKAHDISLDMASGRSYVESVRRAFLPHRNRRTDMNANWMGAVSPPAFRQANLAMLVFGVCGTKQQTPKTPSGDGAAGRGWRGENVACKQIVTPELVKRA